jgi:tRNA dimethylallyltransferase
VRPVVLGARWDRDELRQRIRHRLEERLASGMIEEVEGLLARGVSWDKLEFFGLEYRYVARFLRGEIRNRNDLTQKLHSAICRFAKRQQTWWRRMERRGVRIHWIERSDVTRAVALVAEQLAQTDTAEGQ